MSDIERTEGRGERERERGREGERDRERGAESCSFCVGVGFSSCHSLLLSKQINKQRTQTDEKETERGSEE